MAEITKKTEQDIAQLQNIQRQMQIISAQKQRFELENTIIDQAIVELDKAKGKTFKSIGGLLIESKPAELKKELGEKKETLKGRLDALTKQEERLKSKGEELRSVIEKAISPKSPKGDQE